MNSFPVFHTSSRCTGRQKMGSERLEYLSRFPRQHRYNVHVLSKKTMYFFNKSRMQAVRDLWFSSVDREDIRTYFSSVIHRSNHFQTNHLCRTFKKMHENQLPLRCSFGKKLRFRWLSNMI